MLAIHKCKDVAAYRVFVMSEKNAKYQWKKCQFNTLVFYPFLNAASGVVLFQNNKFMGAMLGYAAALQLQPRQLQPVVANADTKGQSKGKKIMSFLNTEFLRTF